MPYLLVKVLIIICSHKHQNNMLQLLLNELPKYYLYQANIQTCLFQLEYVCVCTHDAYSVYGVVIL